VGERQLLCLARAILNRNRILVMDEATANVDMDTDAKVQSAIRANFTERGNTVIMIAHRLQTIIDCDQVIVMAQGRIAESGHPHELLCRYLGNNLSSSSSGSLVELAGAPGPGAAPPRDSLASMALETGPAMCLHLRRLASAAMDRTAREKC
jgi:ABC-type multidrug transport system ATPase subunit